MKRFLGSYAALAVIFFLLTVVGAFVVGYQAPSRWDSSSGLSQEAVPSPLESGLNALASIALLVVVGFGVRFVAYRRFDSAGVTSRVGWVAIFIAEATYLAFNLWIAYGASTPAVDAGFVWLITLPVALAVTLVSLALLATAGTLARRRKAAADAAAPLPAA